MTPTPRRRRTVASWARRVVAAVPSIALSATLAGCAFLPRPTETPMPTELDRASCTARADTLLVLLPGRGMDIDEFKPEGFVAAVRQMRLAVDVLRADAHMAYYMEGRIVQRLRNDVITPARAQGYRHIWLAGISLGGFGALTYASARPTDLDGVLALAPYLGESDVTDDIAAAGGLRDWWAPVAVATAEERRAEFARRLWRALKPYAAASPAAGRPPLYLGYGLEDRFAAGHRLLADVLPTDRVFTMTGGHDWNTWTALWQDMLAAASLPRCGA